MIIMTRRLTFSAAHADWLSGFTEEENKRLFGGEASPMPYGHNYGLDVSVCGEINPTTGILVNIKEIDRIVKERVVQLLDKKFINQQLLQFGSVPVTLENLADFIAGQLRCSLPPEVRLCRIRLEATPTHYVEWQDGQPEPGRIAQIRKERRDVLLTRVYEFSASHRLHSPHLSASENQELFGKCNYENGHGHNYEFEVTLAGPVEARSGRVFDPAALDAIVEREVLERYDHRHLNVDIPEFSDLIPSAEIITRVIWQRLYPHITGTAHLYRILVRETPRNIFEYYGEEEGEDRGVQ